MTTRQKVEAFLGAASGRRGMGTWREWLRGVLYLIEDHPAALDMPRLDGAEGWNEALVEALKAHGIKFCHVLDYLFPEAPADETGAETVARTLREFAQQAATGPLDGLDAIAARCEALRLVLGVMNTAAPQGGGWDAATVDEARAKWQREVADLQMERARLNAALDLCWLELEAAHGNPTTSKDALINNLMTRIATATMRKTLSK